MKGLGTGLPPRILGAGQALCYVLYRNHLSRSFQQPSAVLMAVIISITVGKWRHQEVKQLTEAGFEPSTFAGGPEFIPDYTHEVFYKRQLVLLSSVQKLRWAGLSP